ncbi:helix-turn-helix domain-containing protein [Arthrobacter glacialis]|uniref:Transcriptional regulator n=1 Tax=Arthrobacter glacialis TaxID=1664 RepID=A0A2S4A0Y5_ARTGL|nr:helix-turn-helix transcriptional regulator [Arthrobacter glacialis]POH75171.1 transcriptional regulator [Arthrobacter glacialis]
MIEKPRTFAGIGTTIREARIKRGWSQTVLGERAGVSRPTVARIEADHDISTATLSKVATALGLTVELEVRE